MKPLPFRWITTATALLAAVAAVAALFATLPAAT